MGALQKTEPDSGHGALIIPSEMVEKAINAGSGPEVMEKLLALQERWEANQAKKAFDNAMAQLRENLPPIIKRQEVDYTPRNSNQRVNYRYEDLTAVTEALAPVMTPLGLSFRWRTDSGSNGVTVTCIIAHRDGHREETSLTSSPDQSGGKNSIQAIGSAVTYLQRYTLKAAVGIAASYDDDGHGTTPEHQEPKEQPKKADARSLYADVEHQIRNAPTKAALADVWAKTDWDAIPKDWHKDLVKEAEDRVAKLKAAALAKQQPTQEPNFDNLDADPFPGDLPTDEHGYTAADYVRS